ncbi:MAG: sensor histidine kinase [Bdellovibrionales bacterium]|nr:sensor histidine kinase [Bdellovibrionales bacterium]
MHATQQRQLSHELTMWAHDIRSPLLSLQVIANTSKDIHSQQRELLELTIDRLLSMSRDVLSKVSGASCNTPATSLAESIDRVISEKWIQLRTRPGVILETRLSPRCSSTNTTLAGSALERILSNLIDNAIHAINNAGQVTVMACVAANHALIEISDSGTGMSAQQIAAAHNGTLASTKIQGHGLGLSSSIRSVQNVGGQVDIESSPKTGTQIRLRIPLSHF